MGVRVAVEVGSAVGVGVGAAVAVVVGDAATVGVTVAVAVGGGSAGAAGEGSAVAIAVEPGGAPSPSSHARGATERRIINATVASRARTSRPPERRHIHDELTPAGWRMFPLRSARVRALCGYISSRFSPER